MEFVSDIKNKKKPLEFCLSFYPDFRIIYNGLHKYRNDESLGSNDKKRVIVLMSKLKRYLNKQRRREARTHTLSLRKL